MVKLLFVADSKPISVISSLSTGFDRVASQPYLIIPPLILDLFLWLGPQLRIAQLIESMTEQAVQMEGLVAEQASLVQEIVQDLGESFNLLSALSTLPIGIPSLMAGRPQLETPLGLGNKVDLSDPGQILLFWIGLSAIGLASGAFYQYWIALAVAPAGSLGSSWLAALRIVGFGFLAFAGAFFAGFVVLIAIVVATLILPLLGTGVFFLGFALLFWMAVYLIFTPHGIIRYNFGVIRAMLESFIVVRWNLLSTVGFLFLAFGSYWLLSYVWALPSGDSWFALLAVMGHAFVATTLLAASYAYYQGRRDFLVEAGKAALIRFGPPEG